MFCGKFKKLYSAFLSGIFLFLCVGPGVPVFAEGGTVMTPADGVNVTRWADLLVVYKDRPTTGQNEWGHNVVVGADGKVTNIIQGGDLAGKDLAIPEGGMVVSATGYKIDWLKKHISVGSYVRFDEVTGRVMVSDRDEFDVRFRETKGITGYNSIRLANTLVLYDHSMEKTGTNGYGYEIGVDKDGVVVFSGGNDSTVPENGFVLSAIEPDDRLFLKTYGVVGATCVLSEDKKSFTLIYSEEEIVRSAEMQMKLLEDALSEAERDCLLVDTSLAKTKLDAAKAFLSSGELTRLDRRSTLYALMDEVALALSEQKNVEVRSVWYVPLETTPSAVRRTVEAMAGYGINQLCIGLENTKVATPVPEGSEFRRDPKYRAFDILKVYSEACKGNGIELVVTIPVFYSGEAASHPEWRTFANRDGAAEADVFYSPASEAYYNAFSAYITYLLENYDINGIQLDYIRYPYFDGVYDYGYDEQTKALFASRYGVDPSEVDAIGRDLRSHPLWNKWSSFKRDLITSWVERLGTLVREKRPDVYFSVCLAADAHPESYFQSGKDWAESGLIDAVYPMSYAEGIMAEQSAFFSSFDALYYCIEGSGSYCAFPKREQRLQVEQTRAFGADGIGFFEWGTFVAHGYADDLQKGLFREKACSPSYDPEGAVQNCLSNAAARLQKAESLGYVPSGTADAFASASEGYTSEKRSALNAMLSEYQNENWCKRVLAELDTADKTLSLAKEKRVIPTVTEPEPAEPEVSEEIPSPEETPSSSALPWILVGTVAVLAAAGGVLLVLRKKKSQKGNR